MDSFSNRSPLYTVVSRKVISFSEISAVNFIVGWNLLTCAMNRLISYLFTSHSEKTSLMKRFHTVSLTLLWLSISAMKMLAKDTAICVPVAVPRTCR